MRVPVLVAWLVVAIVPGLACRQAQPTSAAPEYTPTATIKDIMLSIVDPSADVVWEAVTTVSDGGGTTERVPGTDEEWVNVRRGAVTLLEASNLLLVPGRRVAQHHEKSEAPGVELEPEQMEILINKDRAAWNSRARDLHSAAVEALQAIDAKDAQKLFDVGEHIERACENCHSHYWYPNQQLPSGYQQAGE
jgi:hypothetical protein